MQEWYDDEELTARLIVIVLPRYADPPEIAGSKATFRLTSNNHRYWIGQTAW
jgi:hypothetical protein